MKKRVYIILIFAMLINVIGFNESGHASNNYLDIKIGTKNLDQRFSIESAEGFNIYENKDEKSKIAEISDNKINISINKDKTLKILNLPENTVDLSIDNTLIESKDSMIQLDGNKYRGYILFRLSNRGVNIINHIDIDEYLYGVVPKEIPPSSNHEALKAQAVAARSFAYINKSKHSNEGYNLCNTTHCQVYGGISVERPTTNQAVIDTYGEYVSYDGEVINTPYHSNSGGHTEDSSNVWGGNSPWLIGVKDEHSNNSPNSSWTMNISSKEIQNKLSNAGINIGSILNLEVQEQNPSGRVKSIRIIGSKKEETITGEKFRTIMGNTYLKSTLFTIHGQEITESSKIYAVDGYNKKSKEVNLNNIHIVNKSQVKNIKDVDLIKGKEKERKIDKVSNNPPGTFILQGKGYGHGVGMSQYGAIEMAKKGYNYRDIIKHYYKDSEIISLGR